VTSPSPVAIAEVLAFHEKLHAESMPVAGVVANRVSPDLWPEGSLPSASALAAALRGRAGGKDLAAKLARTLAEHQTLARAERQALDRLFAALDAPRSVVPRLETDVHDLAGLARLRERL
jgi:hypothetical protein